MLLYNVKLYFSTRESVMKKLVIVINGSGGVGKVANGVLAYSAAAVYYDD